MMDRDEDFPGALVLRAMDRRVCIGTTRRHDQRHALTHNGGPSDGHCLHSLIHGNVTV
jgi:hypothetical protein